MPLGRSNALAASAFRSTNAAAAAAAVEFSAISVQGFLLQLYKQVSVVTRRRRCRRRRRQARGLAA